MKYKNVKNRCGKYGIKAYGTWTCFDSISEYRFYLLDWIRGTEGAERDRAVDALVNLDTGVNFTNTDGF